MKRRKRLYPILLLLLIFPALCFSYNWQSIGPTDIEANNFYAWGGGIAYEIICTSNSMLVNINGEWEEFSNSGLPVWDVEAVVMATADLMMIMGNGSYSDGIYLYNFSNYEMWVTEYFVNPRFIELCPADGCYYVGGEQGLKKAEFPTNWEVVEYFNYKYCYDMAVSGNNYVVAADDGVHYSDDAGLNWYPANTIAYLTDLEFSANGILYGIFPDESWSSGLWSSTDFGLNWEVEFWSILMSSVGFDCDNNLFVGWEEPIVDHEGIAMWTPDIWELTFMNEGLGNLNINRITTHPLIDCINIVACTDGGVYLLSDYPTDIEEDIDIESNIKLTNFPNPFSSSTTISFNLTTEITENTEILIYNLKGQKVRVMECINSFDAQATKPLFHYSIDWNGKDESGIPVSSGIYFYKLKSGKESITKKMLLLR